MWQECMFPKVGVESGACMKLPAVGPFAQFFFPNACSLGRAEAIAQFPPGGPSEINQVEHPAAFMGRRHTPRHSEGLATEESLQLLCL